MTVFGNIKERCPESQELRAGDESATVCMLNGKFCLLESDVTCFYYEEYLLEFEADE